MEVVLTGRAEECTEAYPIVGKLSPYILELISGVDIMSVAYNSAKSVRLSHNECES